MRDIGLIPENCNDPKKQTGQKVTHSITDDGPFDVTCRNFLAHHPTALYHDRGEENPEKRKKKAASKTKYTCPGCELNAWAKPEAHLICGDCNLELEPEERTSEDDEQ
jgi:hypothetical protein